MPKLTIRTPEGVVLHRELAGPASRFASWLLDGLLLVCGLAIIGLSIAFLAQFDPSGFSGLIVGILVGGGILILLLYPMLFELRTGGQSPGKQTVGLRVASADGLPLRASQIVLRALILPVDFFPLLFLPNGFWVSLFTPKRQRLGDLVAGTVVLHDVRQEPLSEPFQAATYDGLEEAESTLGPRIRELLGPEDLSFLRALHQRQSLDANRKRALFVSAGRHYAQRLGVEGFDDARPFLRNIYLLLRKGREAA